MKTFLLALLLLPGLARAQRPKLNLRLKHELDSLYFVDQVYREALLGEHKQHLVDSLAAAQHFAVAEAQSRLISLMLITDSSNIRRVQTIIQRHGYPGKSLVGTPTNEAVFFIVQHSNRIAQYLPLIKQAADRGELPFRLYAMMLDRHLMQHNQPQVYGTQGFSFGGAVDPATGQQQTYQLIWPIQDAARVNERRKQAGFEQTVEENAQRLGIKYRPLTLEQVQKMPGFHPFN